MIQPLRILPLCCGFVGLASGTAAAQPLELEIPMSDGVVLSAQAFGVGANPEKPIVLVRTPYGGATVTGVALSAYAQSIVVIQHTRGQSDSGGVDRGFLTDAQDGLDTLRWLVDESGLGNGVIGSYGPSALAINQMLMAPGAPPEYRCQHLVVGSSALASHGIYRGGVRRVDFDAWAENQGISYIVEDWEAHPDPDDPFWDPVVLDGGEVLAIQTRGLHTGGWFDVFVDGTLDYFRRVQSGGGDGARGQQRLVIGPFTHGGKSGDLDYPGTGLSETPVTEANRAWVDDCIHGRNGDLAALPNIQLFVMGASGEDDAAGNEWRAYERWPPESSAVALYLEDGGVLGLEAPAADSSSSAWAHDPADPVPAVGGNNLTLPAGPMDQRAIEERAEVAVFETAVIEDPFEIIGEVTARLWLETEVDDAQVVVRLTDVYPDGRSMLMLMGPQRVTGAAGTPREVSVSLGPTALAFNRGHRLRISVSGAAAGAFAVVPEPFSATVLHDADHPSRLVLPVTYGLAAPSGETEPGPEPIESVEATETDAPDSNSEPSEPNTADEGGQRGCQCSIGDGSPPWIAIALVLLALGVFRRRAALRDRGRAHAAPGRDGRSRAWPRR